MIPAKKNPRLLILSTGRAGSSYIASVLTDCGLPCGHEQVASRAGWDPRNAQAAESSWLALPHVEKGRASKAAVVHQIRDPLRVLSSLLNGQMKGNANNPTAGFQQISYHTGMPKPSTDAEWLEFAVRYVWNWNYRCTKKASFTYRIEGVSVLTVAHLMKLAGTEPDLHRIDQVLGGVSTKSNTRPPGPRLTWDTLPDIAETRALRRMAESFGYGEQHEPPQRIEQ